MLINGAKIEEHLSFWNGGGHWLWTGISCVERRSTECKKSAALTGSKFERKCRLGSKSLSKAPPSKTSPSKTSADYPHLNSNHFLAQLLFTIIQYYVEFYRIYSGSLARRLLYNLGCKQVPLRLILQYLPVVKNLNI